MAPSQVWWVQPLATSIGVIVTFFGVIVALVAIARNRHVARLKATIDLIEGSESKEYYQTRYRAYRKYRGGGKFREGVLNPSCEEQKTDRDNCKDFLNHFELVALACKKGIIDGKFYRLWMGPAFVRDWNCATDLVRASRSACRPGDRGNPSAYKEFEVLAVKWGGTRLD